MPTRWKRNRLIVLLSGRRWLLVVASSTAPADIGSVRAAILKRPHGAVTAAGQVSAGRRSMRTAARPARSSTRTGCRPRLLPSLTPESGHLVRRTSVPSMMFRVESVQQFLVSTSGQMSLPAAVRRRWHLDHGGPVDVVDLGFGVLTVPAGEARRILADLLSRDEHAAFVASLSEDPDLATT